MVMKDSTMLMLITLWLFHCATYIILMDSWSEQHEAGKSVIHTAPHKEEHYRSNSLRANPDKMQVTAIHLRNREAKRSLQVSWNGVDLEYTDTPKYLGVTLDRTLIYKTHIHNTKMKVATRNNLLNKLANSRWGTKDNQNHSLSLMLLYC